MQIGYLGPLEVRDGDRTVDVPGRRLRTLLGRLATDVGRPVPARTLIQALWPEDIPADPANALQSLVSRLRRALRDPTLVEQLPGGYRLNVRPEDVDAVRFARLAAQGRSQLAAGATAQAGETLRSALELWRGEPLPDDESHEAGGVRSRWGDLRLQAQTDRIEADLSSTHQGDAAHLAGLVSELDQLVAAHPLREDLAGLRMRALVAMGRPAEALVAYESTRSYLADTLGSDPSPALQEQHLAVLRSQDDGPATRRTNLRAAVTSFVGRDEDAARVEALLAGPGRLVTIVGAGGAGKTRLASEVAAGWVGRTADGVWFVELAPVGEAENVALAVLDGLGSRELTADPLERAERPARETRERIIAALTDSDALVVMDNCEHVVGAAATMAADILGQCPDVRLIATSREPLGIDGEVLYPLTPLRLPDEGATAEQAAGSAAVQLLLDRARAAGAAVVLDDDTAAEVVEVVRRLDGLPLAIELAAARLRAMPVAELALRLGDRFRLLTGGRRTAMPRHRTLRAVVEWSWDLLSDDERQVAERFSVFGSGASAEAVAAVCPGADPARIEDLLHALVDKSLLVPVANGVEARFRMLETLREYGGERLAEQGALEPTRTGHAHYYAELVRTSDTGLRGPEQMTWLRRLDVDRDNLLTALTWLGEHDEPVEAVEMAVGLVWYWMLRENGTDGARWLRFALELPGAVDAEAYPVAEALLVITELATPGSGSRVSERHDRLVTLAEQLGGVVGSHPLVLLLAPLLYFFAEEHEKAQELTERNLSAEDPWLRAASRTIRIAFRENQGDIEGMRRDVEEGAAEWERLGDHWGLATILSSRGQLRTLDGDTEGATVDFEAAADHLRRLGSSQEDLMVTIRLADLRLRSGDYEGARRLAEGVRGELSPSADPTMIGDGRAALSDVMLGGIAFILGDQDNLEASRQRLLVLVNAQTAPSLWHAHLLAVAYGFLAVVAAQRKELAEARQLVGEAIRHGLQTHDFPILSSAGVAVAYYAHAAGRDRDAAQVLGAAARLRGADDPTQTMVARLVSVLRESLGEDYDGAYDSGRAMNRERALARLDPAVLD